MPSADDSINVDLLEGLVHGLLDGDAADPLDGGVDVRGGAVRPTVQMISQAFSAISRARSLGLAQLRLDPLAFADVPANPEQFDDVPVVADMGIT